MLSNHLSNCDDGDDDTGFDQCVLVEDEQGHPINGADGRPVRQCKGRRPRLRTIPHWYMDFYDMLRENEPGYDYFPHVTPVYHSDLPYGSNYDLQPPPDFEGECPPIPTKCGELYNHTLHRSVPQRCVPYIQPWEMPAYPTDESKNEYLNFTMKICRLGIGSGPYPLSNVLRCPVNRPIHDFRFLSESPYSSPENTPGPFYLPAGSPCDDGDYRTENDVCTTGDATSVCRGTLSLEARTSDLWDELTREIEEAYDRLSAQEIDRGALKDRLASLQELYQGAGAETVKSRADALRNNPIQATLF